MKVFCRQHGVHFPHEFNITCRRGCPFWGDHGLQKLPTKYKRKVWEWLFALNADELFGETGYEIALQFYGRRAPIKHLWHNVKKGYAKLSEKQRQAFQKRHVRKSIGGASNGKSRKN